MMQGEDQNPNFFIIGSPKCGTTALTEYLREHPNVYMTNPKEPHYFNSDFAKGSSMSYETYMSLFKEVNPEVHRAVGEASTAYLYSEVAVPNIIKLFPLAKMIVMVRNPIDLMRALHSEMLFWGTENIQDLGTAWQAEEDRKKGNRIPLFCSERKRLLYSRWSMLGDQIERLFKVVNPEQVKLIFFEDFVKNPKSEYEDVLRFLKLPSIGKKDFKKYNESKKVRIKTLQPIFGFFIRALIALKFRLGITKFTDSLTSLLYLNSMPYPKTTISDGLREELRLFFKNDVEKLSKLTNRDLSRWMVS